MSVYNRVRTRPMSAVNSMALGDSPGEEIWPCNSVVVSRALDGAQDLAGGGRKAVAAASGTVVIDIWQKLHVEGDFGRCLPAGTAQRAGVVRGGKLCSVVAQARISSRTLLQVATAERHDADAGGVGHADAADAGRVDSGEMGAQWARVMRVSAGTGFFHDQCDFA
ncbi:hypothetical protein ACFVJ5_27880 [Nocardia sp. NPDC127606]|uniref:hypothetical protein n=1 Tax=Nocardia sp. NPDC127606 TaxID=3345406 RepID=UPI003639E3BF